MFVKGHRYRHKDCLDVDVIVTKVIVSESPEYVKANVLYWHRTLAKVMIPEIEEVKIKTEDFKNWEMVE